MIELDFFLLRYLVSLFLLFTFLFKLIGGLTLIFVELLDKFVYSLNIFSLDECLERRDSIDRGICLKIDGGWFDSLCVNVISLYGL